MALNDTLFSFLIKKNLRGKDRLYKLLSKLGFRKYIIQEAKYGIVLNLNPNEYIDKIIIRESFYESEITDLVLKNLNANETFWDIGANIGIHGVAVKKKLPAVNVYCFEPNPKILGLLYENMMLNNTHINICSFALFDKEGIMPLYIAEAYNSGMTTLEPVRDIGYSSTMQCLVTTGDKLVADGFAIPNVIKLDTEGTELNVLRGCMGILADPVLKLIIFEAYNEILQENNNELLVLLKEAGFNQIKPLIRKESTHHDLSNFAATRS